MVHIGHNMYDFERRETYRTTPKLHIEEVIGLDDHINCQTPEDIVSETRLKFVTNNDEEVDHIEAEYTFDYSKLEMSESEIIDEVTKKALDHIKKWAKDVYWWMSDDHKEARENGGLVEQLTFQNAFAETQVYNFTGVALQRPHIEIISDTFNSIFCKPDLPFNRDIAVVFDETEPGNVNPLTGEPTKGQTSTIPVSPFFPVSYSYIKIFPASMEMVEGDLPGMDRFEHTLAHEWGHGLNYDAKSRKLGSENEEWLNMTGWETIDGEYHSTLEAEYWQLLEPDRAPPRPYSRYNPEEDLADSFSCLLLNPTILDKERHNHLVQRYYGGDMGIPAIGPVSIIRRSGSAIVLPKLEPQEMTIKVVLPDKK